MLTKMVLNIFLTMLEGLLWISMIGSVIFGAVTGYQVFGFFGALLGIVVGVVLTTVSWGFILLFVDIRNALNESRGVSA